MSTLRLPSQNSGLPTFAEAKADRGLRTIAQVCNNSDDFKSLLNEATKRLMDRGDWPGTELPIQINVSGGVVTFPRIVGTVRALNLCRSGVPVYGDWYRFLNHEWRHGTCCGQWQALCSGSPVVMTQYGTGIQFAEIPSSTCVLKVYSVQQDNGAIIQFFVTNPQGQPLTTTSSDGLTISDGISITCNQPFTVDTNLVANIGRVIKPLTNGPIQVSALDTVTNIETPIAAFDAGDTNPGFAQYRLQMNQCISPQPVIPAIALVKLKFIPVVADTDPVLIPNLYALKLFMQGIRFGEAGDRANALGFQADAVKELNLEMDNVLPAENIPITMNPFGSALPSRAGIGRLL